MKGNNFYINGSGFKDPTAGKALSNIHKEMDNRTPKPVRDLRQQVIDICRDAGYDVVDVIALQDRSTGKTYY